MARCLHNSGNIQQFTEICLDCGHNIYETDEEYEASLRQDIQRLRKALGQHRIAELEKTKEDLERQLAEKENNSNNDSGW